MCKQRIERYLFKQYGITSVKVDVKKKTTTVTWLTDRTNIENIKTLITAAGYEANEMAPDPEAYKRLPKCCKKPAEAAPVPESKG
jgi:copper chaperone CopZ